VGCRSGKDRECPSSALKECATWPDPSGVHLHQSFRHGGALALATLVTVVWPAAAAGQASAPACGDDLENLSTSAPRVALAGKLLAVFSEDEVFGTVENSEVLFAGQAIPYTQELGGRTRVLVPAPSTTGRYDLTFSWYQPEEGTPCVGSDQHGIRVVPPDSRLGDTDLGRVAGRWAMTFRPLNYRGRVIRRTWRWRPACDYGACDARASSNSRSVFRFRLRSNGTLFAKTKVPRVRLGRCIITRSFAGVVLSRRVIKRAYTARFEDTLRVSQTREQGGLLQARAIRGVDRAFAVPIPEARRAGCRTQILRHRITGRAL